MQTASDRLLKQQMTILNESPQVMAKRITMFSQPLWTWNVFVEYQRMYLEKIVAMQELWYQWAKFFFSPANTRMLSQVPSINTYYRWLNDSTRAANRALYPVSRRVHANQRRLSKIK